MRSDDLTQPLDAEETFDRMAQGGEAQISKLRSLATSPLERKALDPVGATEAARLIGVSRETVANMVERGDIEAVIQRDKAQRQRKKYEFATINRARELQGTRPRRPDGAPPIIINVGNLKGGSSKTTTAVHGAQYFARAGYRVLLVDTDPQASATAYMGIIPDLEVDDEQTVGPALLEDPNLLKDAVQKTYWDGLDLIGASLSLVAYELELTLEPGPGRARALRRALRSVADNYDIVIIDTPPAFGLLSLNGMTAADCVLIPVRPALLDVASCIQYWRILRDMAAKNPDYVNISMVSILLSQVKNVNEHIQMGRMLRNSYPETVMAAELVETHEVAKCAVDLRTVYETRDPAGSRETWLRANEKFDAVFLEVSEAIHAFWAAHVAQADTAQTA